MLAGLTAASGGSGGSSLGTLVVYLTADSVRLVQGMKQAELSMSTAEATIVRGAKLMSSVAIGAFAAIGAAATREFARFDQAMTQATAIMGQLGSETRRELAGVARSLAGETIQSAEDLARGYRNLAAQGLNAEQSLKALPTVTRFATAASWDLDAAINHLVDTQQAFGTQTKDAVWNARELTRISDVIVRGAQLAGSGMREFAEALSPGVANAMRGVNKPAEEAAAVLAAYGQRAIKGGEAAQRLTLLMGVLQAESIQNAAAFDLLGIKIYDVDKQMRPMADIVRDFERVLGGATDQEKRAALELLGFERRTIGAITPLIGLSGSIRDFQRDLAAAGGATNEISERVLAAFSSQLAITKNRFNELLLIIGEQLAPHLASLNQWLQDVAASMKAAESSAGTLTAVVGTVVDLFKTFGLGLAAVWTVLNSVATIMATSVVGGFELVSNAVNKLIRLHEQYLRIVRVLLTGSISEIWTTVGSAVSESAKIVAEGIGQAQQTLVGHGKRTVDELTGQWQGLVDTYERTFGNVQTSRLKNFTAGVTQIKTATEGLTAATNSLAQAQQQQANTQLSQILNSKAMLDLLQKMGAVQTPIEQMGLTDQTESLRRLGVSQATLDRLGRPRPTRSRLGGGFGGDQFMGQSTALSEEQQAIEDRLAILQEAGEKEASLTEEVQRRKLEAIRGFQQQLHEITRAQVQLVLQSGHGMFDELGRAVETFAGQQSGAYGAMFAASKAFAVAEAVVKIQQAIAQAWADPSATTIWQKLASVAAIVSATASIVSNIGAVRLKLAGREQGGPVTRGQTVVVGEGGPELFTPSADGMVSPHRSWPGSSMRVIVNNYTDARATVSERTEGQQRVVEVMIRRVKQEIGGEIRDGVGLVSQAMERTYALRRGR